MNCAVHPVTRRPINMGDTVIVTRPNGKRFCGVVVNNGDFATDSVRVWSPEFDDTGWWPTRSLKVDVDDETYLLDEEHAAWRRGAEVVPDMGGA